MQTFPGPAIAGHSASSRRVLFPAFSRPRPFPMAAVLISEVFVPVDPGAGLGAGAGAGAGAAQVQRFGEQAQAFHHHQHSQPSTTRHSATATKACLSPGKAMASPGQRSSLPGRRSESCRWSLTQDAVLLVCFSLVPWAAQRPRATRIYGCHTAQAPKPHVRPAKCCFMIY